MTHETLPPVDPSTRSDLEVLVGQARWLVEAHQHRSDSIGQRAATLLGMVGVLLGLILSGLSDKLVPVVTVADKLLASASLSCLFISALMMVWVIMLRTAALPGHDELQGLWVDYQKDPASRDLTVLRIVNSYFNPRDPDKGPIGAAMRAANVRAKRYQWGVVSFVAGLMGLMALAVMVIWSR